ncbi:MAG: hypothetical protein AAFV53_31245 [Myxococcota bacterium]
MFWMILLAGCSDMSTITVTVTNHEETATVEVVDQAEWYSEIERGEGFYAIKEDAALPIVFEVPAGDYAVVVSQGTCNQTRDLSVQTREDVTLSLELVCNE